MLYKRSLLFIHSFCNSLHLLTPNSKKKKGFSFNEFQKIKSFCSHPIISLADTVRGAMQPSTWMAGDSAVLMTDGSPARMEVSTRRTHLECQWRKPDQHPFFFFSYFYFIGTLLIYRVVLVSGVEKVIQRYTSTIHFQVNSEARRRAGALEEGLVGKHDL